MNATPMTTGPEPGPTGFTPYDYTQESPATWPTAGVPCAVVIPDQRNTEVVYPCGWPSVAEIPTTSGDWAPACARHTTSFDESRPASDARRSRPLRSGMLPPGEFLSSAPEPALRAEQQPTKDDLAPAVRWRVGRHVKRTVYLQPGDGPDRDADVLIGVLDTPYLAELACAAVNARRAPLPTRAEVQAMAETAMREHIRSLSVSTGGTGVPTTAGAVLAALHEAGWLAWQERT